MHLPQDLLLRHLPQDLLLRHLPQDLLLRLPQDLLLRSSRYLFLWGHELASSFRLFRLLKFFLQMMTNFSKIHKLHLLLTLLYGLHCLMILHLMVKGFLLCSVVSVTLFKETRETKLNCQNTFGHSKTTRNLLPSSGESLSSADYIATLATNVIYVFLRNSSSSVRRI